MTVVDACAQFWTADVKDCAKFAGDVATALGVTLTGGANDIRARVHDAARVV